LPVLVCLPGDEEERWGLICGGRVAIAGRVGLQAFKRYKAGADGAVGVLGKQFYKGGFENRMTRREAALILQMRYAIIIFSG